MTCDMNHNISFRHATESDADALLDLLSGFGALRVKGFVDLDSGPAIVQGVGRRIETVLLDNPPPEGMMGRVVVIRRR